MPNKNINMDFASLYLSQSYEMDIIRRVRESKEILLDVIMKMYNISENDLESPDTIRIKIRDIKIAQIIK